MLFRSRVRHEMVALARPIISFLNKMYPSEPAEEPHQRAIAESVRPLDMRSLAKGSSSAFETRPRRSSKEKTTVRVAFDAQKSDIEKVKKYLRRPELSAGAVAEFAFKEYLHDKNLK